MIRKKFETLFGSEVPDETWSKLEFIFSTFHRMFPDIDHLVRWSRNNSPEDLDRLYDEAVNHRQSVVDTRDIAAKVAELHALAKSLYDSKRGV